MRGNMNPKQMKQAMKQLGIEQEDVEASKVVIHTEDKRLVFTDPSVQKVDMMGQETYQVMGTPQEEPVQERNPKISDDDIQTVVDKTGCTETEAREAIKANDYDLAAATMAVQDG